MEQSGPNTPTREQAKLKPYLDRIQVLLEIDAIDANTAKRLFNDKMRLAGYSRYDRVIPSQELVKVKKFLWEVEKRHPPNLVKSASMTSLAPTADKPPSTFAFVLACTARPGRAEEVLGDAEDEFRRMVTQLGVAQARWWYRLYVSRAVIRMLPGVLMRMIFRSWMVR
jgi:hypothetical protein